MQKKFFLAIAALLILSGCGLTSRHAPEATPDPCAGLVKVASGQGTHMWVKEYPDVPVNPLREVSVVAADAVTDENGNTYALRRGIDVSEHQGVVDWAQVAGSGIEFAILRAGYRGYGTEGAILADACFGENLKGTAEQGLDIGIYFFSQATCPAEAEEEADFLIGLLRTYAPQNLTLPVFYDWERIDYDVARTDDVSDETMCDCTVAFCERLREAGYHAGVYTFRFFAYHSYDLSRIKDYPLWVAALGDEPDFYYRFDIWQRSVVGHVKGVEGKVDMDVIFVPQSAGTEAKN